MFSICPHIPITSKDTDLYQLGRDTGTNLSYTCRWLRTTATLSLTVSHLGVTVRYSHSHISRVVHKVRVLRNVVHTDIIFRAQYQALSGEPLYVAESGVMLCGQNNSVFGGTLIWLVKNNRELSIFLKSTCCFENLGKTHSKIFWLCSSPDVQILIQKGHNYEVGRFNQVRMKSTHSTAFKLELFHLNIYSF